jgi:hypothetical protein
MNELGYGEGSFLWTSGKDVSHVDHGQMCAVVAVDNRAHIGSQPSIAGQIRLQAVCKRDNESVGKTNSQSAGREVVLSGSAKKPFAKSFGCIGVTIEIWTPRVADT